jgi:hypothetical protein
LHYLQIEKSRHLSFVRGLSKVNYKNIVTTERIE